MNIVFIGCVAFSKACLQTLIALSQRHSSLHITGVVTKQSSPFNADFCDIAPLARTHNIKAFYTTDINDASTREFIISCAPDIIYCFGWSALIKQALLDLCPIIGYHPAALPHNRGRHPIIWALALGLKESASSFFVMDSGADSGAILSQVPFAIESSDNAASLCARVERIAKEQIEDFTLDILERANASLANTKIGGNTESSAQNAQFSQLTGGGADTNLAQILSSLTIPQNHSLSNLWRKRGARDGIIDFRMSAEGIYNLVRALSKPYVGAEVLYNGAHYKVWEAKIVSVSLKNIESGKILRVDSQGVLVKAYDDAILLTHHELNPLPKEGEYF